MLRKREEEKSVMAMTDERVPQKAGRTMPFCPQKPKEGVRTDWRSSQRDF